MQITFTSSDGTFFASTSSALSTDATTQNQSRIVVSCNRTASSHVNYLADNDGVSISNSLICGITWGQEVILVPNTQKEITKVEWKHNGKILCAYKTVNGVLVKTEYTSDSNYVAQFSNMDGQTITCSITYNTAGSVGNNPTGLTIAKQWTNPTWDSPGKWWNRDQTGEMISRSGLDTFDGKAFFYYDGYKSNPQRYNRIYQTVQLTGAAGSEFAGQTKSVDAHGDWDQRFGKARPRVYVGTWRPLHHHYLSFTKPIGNISPIYYVIIGWKGWNGQGGYDSPGVMYMSKGTTLIADARWIDGNYGRRMRYSVHAIYGTGIAPSIGAQSGKTKSERPTNTGGGGNTNTCEEYAAWLLWSNPGTLYYLSYYDYNNGNPTLLQDSSYNYLDKCVIQGASCALAEEDAIRGSFNSTDNTPKYHPINYYYVEKWYKKKDNNTWDTSSSYTYTTAQLAQAKVGTGAIGAINLTNLDSYNGRGLAFAAVIKKKNFEVRFKPYGTSSSPVILPAGTQITLRLNGGDSYRGNTAQEQNYEVDTTPYILDDPIRANWRFLGWEVSSDGKIYTAQWEPNDVTVIYKSGEGSGADKSFTAAYNTPYTVLNYNDSRINFTAPQGKYFIGWSCNNGRTYNPGQSIPRTYMQVSTRTLTAQWGSPWKKVKWIWVYEPDRTDPPDDGDHWYHYRVWVNIK